MSLPAHPFHDTRAPGRVSDQILEVAYQAALDLSIRPLSSAEAALLVQIAASALGELIARREADWQAPPLGATADNVIHLPVVR